MFAILVIGEENGNSTLVASVRARLGARLLRSPRVVARRREICWVVDDGEEFNSVSNFLTCLTQDGSKSDLLNYEKRQRINDMTCFLFFRRLKGLLRFYIPHKKV